MRAARVLWFAGGEFRRDFCFERAATLSFATIISLIPLAVLLLGAAVQFGVGEVFIRYAEEKVFPNLAPAFKTELSSWLESNISRKAFANSLVGVVGFLALVSLITTALGGLTAAERIFNRVWKVVGSRTYLQKLVTFWAILTVSPFVMTASLWIEDFLIPQGGVVERLTHESILLKTLYSLFVPVTVGFFGFTVLYRYLPAARVSVRSAMMGGLVAAVLWEASKRAFYIYVARSSTVTSLYGPLSIVPLFLVWVYLNWLIILWGCELTYAHQNLGLLSDLLVRSVKLRRLPPSFIGVQFLESLARAFAGGNRLPSTSELADDLSIRSEEVENVARILVEGGILVQDSRRPGMYALVRAPAFVRLSDVVALLPGEETPGSIVEGRILLSIPGACTDAGLARTGITADLFVTARRLYLGAFEDKTLEDLVVAREEPAFGGGVKSPKA